jgi:DNA invertase Pin-like site-specific DNA recombinase
MKFSVISPSAPATYWISQRLRELGACLLSLADTWADTSSPAGKMILTVMAGIADFESSLVLSGNE